MKRLFVISLLLYALPGVTEAQWGPAGCGPVGPFMPMQPSMPYAPVTPSFAGPTLTVEVDDPSCEVWIRGAGEWVQLEGYSKTRVASLPYCQSGRSYSYRVYIRWAGGAIDDKTVRFQGGESPRIAFWLANAQQAKQAPKFGLVPDKLGKPGDPSKFESHGETLFQGPANEPRDDSKQPHVTIWSKDKASLEKATSLIQPHADGVKLKAYDLTNPNVLWAAGPFKLDQDKRFQATGFKASFQAPLDDDLRAREVEPIYDPNKVLEGLRKVDPNYDPSRSGGGSGLPPWLTPYLQGINWELVLIAALGVVGLFVIGKKGKTG